MNSCLRWALIGFFLVIGSTCWSGSVALGDDEARPTPSVGPGTLGKDVDPFIGTGGASYLCGFNFPGASVPFGVMRLSPDTVSVFGKGATNSSGYYYSDDRLLGFSHTRLVGTGATDGGNFLVIPCNAETAKASRKGMNRGFSHDRERAFPGYYGIGLPELGLKVELTATDRVGIHRYTFSGKQDPHFLINVTSALGKGQCREGAVRVLPGSSEVEGSTRVFGTFSGRYGGLPVYFVARFDQPFAKFATRLGDEETPDRAEVRGDDIAVNLGFAPSEKERVLILKLAISHVSIANARENLDREVGTATFEQILARATSAWEEKLGRIQVWGGTQRDRTIFRTGLYRCFQMPTRFQDVNGDYLGFDRRMHKAEGHDYYTDLSLWDTFRTVHPLYNLIARGEQRDMVVSLLKMGEQGGYLPRWPSGGGYTNSMFGTPSDIMITEAFLKGIKNFDAEFAYRLMKKTAQGPVPPGSPFSGRSGVEHYFKHEYCPADLMKKSVASTIEYCYADQSIARLADALGHRDEAELFRKHGDFYRNVWNPETKFFQPRDSSGKFSNDFRPEMLTYVDFSGRYTHAYVEGSAWQWRWGVPSDGAGLVALFKDRGLLVQELERFFERSPAGVGLPPNAFYWHGNQPDLHSPFLFNEAGRPDLTQKWVRWILETKYGTGANGLDGNDDGGTLSAWFVLASLGIFPEAGTDRYQLTAPIWTKAEIKLGAKTLTVVSSGGRFVRKIWLNDRLLNRFWLRHAEIADGGTLRFETDDAPPVRP